MGPAPRLVVAGRQWPLHDVAATRSLEAAALAATPAHTLMQRAGLACARLAMALAPHAHTIWVAAGPGNNGGDGMEAALHLHQWGREVVVTLLGNPDTAPKDAHAAHQRALQAGVRFADAPPPQWDLCIDALLGIGATRAPQEAMARWIGDMLRRDAPVLAIDNPTGMDADTGQAASVCVKATATLSLLTLKPGLFTADGRDMAGQVWLDDLQVQAMAQPLGGPGSAIAYLNGRPAGVTRRHASHKGSYGDVAVVGGAPGMGGAALLAASASLHAGAGRVYLCALDPAMAMALVPTQPELMLRDIGALAVTQMTVVCGCGGGDAVREHLPRLVSGAGALVLDADALNALAADSQLQQQLASRSIRRAPAVLTPHPLEAARLLGTTAREVQADRLRAARALSQQFRCTVVLKGSGSVIAAPQGLPAINPTGNASLATAGTGDVLAGLIGARLAAGMPAFEAACASAFQHGDIADRWPTDVALTAAALAGALR
jgi:ADP-dependent NAD(P)H-hydrate dehydratase / NAD(P)H-hydrate epimerase